MILKIFTKEESYVTGSARILVVDDDQIILDTLIAALESEGYSVDSADNGEKAIAMSFSNFYNLAIIDYRLPDIEGTKLLGELKETTPKMAKIILTGYPSMQNAIEAVNKNADAFLLKPVAIDTLLTEIRKLLNEQEKANHYSQAKVAEFIEARTKQVLMAEASNKSAASK
jgi:DNA-binding NtrC family response regulator